MDNTSESFNTSIGKKMRNRRLELKLTQTNVANELGVTFQQVQKYEKGKNGLSAKRLFDLCGVLKVSIVYFTDVPLLPNYTTTSSTNVITTSSNNSLEPLILTKEMEIKC
jgi:transcriptional regulator with XRE-family HTH domain